MRPRRLLVAVGLALVLAAPAGLAQSGVTIDTEARAEGQSLDQASPVEPGTTIDVPTTVSTDAGSDTEWRAFVNATIDGETHDSRTANWTGTATQSLDLSFQAPQEEGSHALAWNVTVESRNASDPGASWTEADRQENQVAFRVQQSAPPPSADDVSVTVRTGSGAPLDELGNLTPGKQIILDGNVTLPDRQDTEWNVTMVAFVNGTRVDSAQQITSTGGSLPFALRFNAPGTTGDHELSWRVDVQYRDTGDDAWTDLTTRQGSTTFTVETLAPPEQPGLPWGWILGVGVLAVAGGGAYYVLREPKQIKGEPKSQAMQDLEGGAAEAETDEPEVHPQVKILEARAEDLRRMIELARERYQDGEITEHQFETIKEKKEAELEEVEEEMEEYRQESAGGE